jgi:DNA-binding XRE family transcriptional regulator
MVNTEDFIKRLEVILDYYSLNASAFADQIGVQRSSLSHLLSGRNKPSLDFVLKIIDVFPEVDLYWFLNGKGSFPKNSELPEKQENKAEDFTQPTPSIPKTEAVIPEDLFSEQKNTIEENPKKESVKREITTSVSSEVEKIVFFYKNGTFKIFNPD